MIVIGIDPSTTCLGLAMVHVSPLNIQVLGSISIRPPSTISRYARLCGIIEAANLAINVWTGFFKVDRFGMEDGFGGPRSSITGALALGEARGIFISHLMRKSPVFLCKPSQAKAAIGAGGGAKKQAVASIVKRLDGARSDITDDECDAVAIAVFAAKQTGEGWASKADLDKLDKWIKAERWK